MAGVASNTRAGKPHSKLAAVHWFTKQRGDRVNSSWKLCHWATRKGSFFRSRICRSITLSSEAQLEPRGGGKGWAAGTLHPSNLLLVKLQKDVGRGKVVPVKQGPPRADSQVYRLPREQRSIYKSRAANGAGDVQQPPWASVPLSPRLPPCSWAGTLPCLRTVTPRTKAMSRCFSSSRDAPATHPRYKSLREESVIQYNLSGATPVPVWGQGREGCAAGQPSFRGKHKAKVPGTPTAKEPTVFSASVRGLNITVSGRNFQFG